MASVFLLGALLVVPWLLTVRRGPGPDTATPAWTPPAQQPVRPWADPDEWWRESSALPSRAPVREPAPALEV
ncbi:hypothetical protein ACI79J_09130 [Geodermatophilus sp. SYSU D01062]